ncbi:MAG: hypothetical protein JW726_09395, partial [Anaerolineales bacterium]|nr:hypothetical protein [Anaerolineales bacterium]
MKKNILRMIRLGRILPGLWILLVVLPSLPVPIRQASADADMTMSTASASLMSKQTAQIYTLPILYGSNSWYNPYGIESAVILEPENTITKNALDALRFTGWARLNYRISWRQLQPEDGSPIQWGLLSQFEAELRNMRTLGIKPIVIVDDYPSWATDNSVRNDGQPTSCGPLLPGRYGAFAVFLQELVKRYRVYEFNVHNWELGNEPDVDPDTVAPDSEYGCWGDSTKLYYNGDAYGEMLKVVTPAIKSVDPYAKVWIGGLLLAEPNSYHPNPEHPGRPELFLKGILEAGAAPYFDIVAFHAYSSYNGERVDQDTDGGRVWDPLGGVVIGKAKF